MKFDLGLAGFALSLIVAASGWFFRWSDKQKFERQQAITEAKAASAQAVNDERDFNHLLGNQKQISQGIDTGFNDVEEKINGVEKKIGELRELMIKIEAYLIRNQGTNHHE